MAGRQEYLPAPSCGNVIGETVDFGAQLHYFFKHLFSSIERNKMGTKAVDQAIRNTQIANLALCQQTVAELDQAHVILERAAVMFVMVVIATGHHFFRQTPFFHQESTDLVMPQCDQLPRLAPAAHVLFNLVQWLFLMLAGESL